MSETVQPTGAPSPRLVADPWQTIVRQRWERLCGLIGEEEYDLTQARDACEREQIRDDLRLLHHAALSVWLDGKHAGIDLTELTPSTVENVRHAHSATE